MKEERINIRLTPDEKRRIKVSAAKHEMTISEYLLWCALYKTA
jgi:uncharacterized protein (DUF1778 family)